MTTILARVRTEFDPSRIQREMQRKKMKFFNRAGAYVRRVSRNSIKQKPKRKQYVPQPGTPPRTKDRSKSRYRNGILYAYDASTDSVVVGPAVRRNANTAWVFETGGTITIWASPEKRKQRRKASSKKQAEAYVRLLKEGRVKQREKQERKRVRATFRKFPVMGPAAKASRPKLSSLLAELHA